MSWQLAKPKPELRLLQSGGNVLVYYAVSFVSRLCGLLFRKPLGADECLAISPCTAVHTFGMRYTIDVVFVDCFGCVTDVCLGIRPWRIASSVSRLAVSAIEFKAGALTAKDHSIGAPLFITPTTGQVQ